MNSFLLLLITTFALSVSGWPNPRNRTQGEVWPLPQIVQYLGYYHRLDQTNFAFRSASQCDVIDAAFQRYKKRVFSPQKQISQIRATLTELIVFFDEPCPIGVPQFGMKEDYKLDTSAENGSAILRATQAWGIIRGLETFSQTVIYRNGSFQIRAAIIKDFPRFPHRGVLMDTARHFLSVQTLKANIDLMAQNKFNVFHWHIVDLESFPYGSAVFPELAKGAYTPDHLYSIADMKDIVEYARLRGIRVIPEFDTPGHMASWGIGLPKLLTRCFDDKGYETSERAMIDPTQENTWDILVALFQEIFTIFPDRYIHLGGDETEFWANQCWKNNRNISEFMSLYGFPNVDALENWYFEQLLARISTIDAKKKVLVWQEVLDNDVSAEGAIAHVWRGGEMLEMAKVTKAGHLAILSSCWYLDHISTASYGDWMDYYKCDPQGFTAPASQLARVLGGEAAMWGEWVDETNVVSRLWPRASAVAERLWSAAAETQNAGDAWPRLYEMTCRMIARGYPAEPAYGPGFCPIEFHNNYPI